jgi:hypothetical protein
VTATSPPPLPADLNEGLKRLKMAAMRRLAPELLLTAKTQRWKPEEFLRTLVEAEIAARDESNRRARMRQAGFPVHKTLAEIETQRRAGTFSWPPAGTATWPLADDPTSRRHAHQRQAEHHVDGGTLAPSGHMSEGRAGLPPGVSIDRQARLCSN